MGRTHEGYRTTIGTIGHNRAKIRRATPCGGADRCRTNAGYCHHAFGMVYWLITTIETIGHSRTKERRNVGMMVVQRTQIFVERTQRKAVRCRAPKHISDPLAHKRMKTQKNLDLAMVQCTQIFVEPTQRKAARCRAPKWTKRRGVIGLFYRFAQQLDVQTLSFYASGRTVDNF